MLKFSLLRTLTYKKIDFNKFIYLFTLEREKLSSILLLGKALSLFFFLKPAP